MLCFICWYRQFSPTIILNSKAVFEIILNTGNLFLNDRTDKFICGYERDKSTEIGICSIMGAVQKIT